MPRHRVLSRERFYRAIQDPALFDQYFATLNFEPRPPPWSAIHPNVLTDFLDDPRNGEVRFAVEEDFRRINDLCGRGMNFVASGYRWVDEPVPQGKNTHTLALRLFVEHRGAFEFAWSQYLLYHCPSTLTAFRFPVCELTLTDEQVDTIKQELVGWFSELAKGDCVHITPFIDDAEVAFLITRGSYLRLQAFWEGDRVGFTNFRPASEDIIVYQRATGHLTIKASLIKDRKQYCRVFARCLAGDERLADAAFDAPAYSLVPLQDGSFDFAGNGSITAIDLVKVGLRFPTSRHEYVEIASDDARATVAERFPELSLGGVTVVFARFVFSIALPGATTVPVSFEVRPPSQTDLPQKRYADVISRYLEEQEVFL